MLMSVHRVWRLLLGLAGVILAFSHTIAAQEAVRLWLGEPDVSAFPSVWIPLHTADFQGAPVSDLSQLSLRENGIPLEFEVTAVPTGMDIIFVLDANADFAAANGSGQTRAQTTAASISQFAGQFMQEDGQDRVSILVPDAAGINGRFLLQNNTNPDIIAQTITAYQPEPAAEIPLQAMMALAIEQAARNNDGRFQAILLCSDNGQLHQQLDFAALTEQANAANLPIYVAILGERADETEIANASRLTEPTGGGYVHVPTADEAQAIFRAWQGQANQTFMVYESLQTHNGRYPITVNLGSVRANTEMTLNLAAPEVALKLTESEIIRTGAAHDTPLTELEPISSTVQALVSWPDGVPRPLTAVILFVGGLDGQTQIQADIQPDADGLLTLNWDMRQLREGGYQLVVQVADGYGYSAESEPAVVIIRTERPDPPTPTPPPLPTPETAVPPPTGFIAAERLWLGLGFTLLAGLIAAVLFWRRWRARQMSEGASEQVGDESDRQIIADPPLAHPQTRPPAYLDGDSIQLPLPGDNVTIGRDETAASTSLSAGVHLTLNDKSVARLHARIRWQNGRYWLYDEGSAGGTSLNFERLGLAPRPLQENDQIQIGRLRFYFRYGDIEEEE